MILFGVTYFQTILVKYSREYKFIGAFKKNSDKNKTHLFYFRYVKELSSVCIYQVKSIGSLPLCDITPYQGAKEITSFEIQTQE